MTDNLTSGLRALVAGSLLLASAAVLLVTVTRVPAAGALAIGVRGAPVVRPMISAAMPKRARMRWRNARADAAEW